MTGAVFDASKKVPFKVPFREVLYQNLVQLEKREHFGTIRKGSFQ